MSINNQGIKGEHLTDMLGIEDGKNNCFIILKPWLWKDNKRYLEYNDANATVETYTDAYKDLMKNNDELFKDLIETKLEKPQVDKMKDKDFVYVFYGFYYPKAEVKLVSLFCRKYKINKYCDKKNKFDLEHVDTPAGLEKRFRIKYKSKTLGAVFTWEELKECDVSEIEPVRKVEPFESYDKIYLTYTQLERIFGKDSADGVEDEEWKKMLSRFAGIYIIIDRKEGKNYVGSASGGTKNDQGGGIWQRWADYVDNPSGSNTRLEELFDRIKTDRKDYARDNFAYCILETLPLTLKKADVDKIETLWKKRIGTLIPKSNDDTSGIENLVPSPHHLNAN